MKILIVRFSSIGDIVLTTPVMRCLKAQTNATIHFLTFARFGSVVERHPAIHKLYTIHDHIREVVPALRTERYDLVIDLHNNLRTLMLKWHLRRPSVAFHKLNLRKYLLVRLGINLLPDRHIVERYLDTVARLNVENDLQGLDIYIDKAAHEVVQTLSLDWLSGYVALVIGGKFNTKIYPAELVAEVINKLNTPVVLLGGPEDTARGDEIVKMTAGSRVISFCGKTTLHQSAALVAAAACVVTNDTGLMHIAAACNQRIVSLWGNTIPELGMYPYMPQSPPEHNIKLEVKGLNCRPCSKIGYQQCPKKHFRCMKEISPEVIVAQVKQWLSSDC
jgi:lipopolysaccharide heptosyltransferase II